MALVVVFIFSTTASVNPFLVASAFLQDCPTHVPVLFPLPPLRNLCGFQILVLLLFLLLRLVFLLELRPLVVRIKFRKCS